MFKTLKNAWRVPELRSKIIFTLWMFAIIRIGSFITIPGIDPVARQSIMSGASEGIQGLMNLVTGGAFSQMAIFAFGVSPYITASIIVQLLTIAITRLEELSKEGEEGKKKINKYTRYLTLAIATMQASATTLMFYNSGIFYEKNAVVFAIAVLSLVAGSMLVMWIGEQITAKGIGNGISLIIFINIVSGLPQAVTSLLAYDNYLKVAILVLFFVILIGFAVLMAQGERKIAVQYAKRTAGRKVYGGQSQHIPIKVNLAGVLPVIFAVSLMQFPTIITQLFMRDNVSDFWGGMLRLLDFNKPVGAIIYVVLIFLFAFFYSTIAFNPMEIATNMKKSGGFIPGIRPGKPTSDYLTKVANHITFMGAGFLAVLAMAPIAFSWIFNMQVAFGGTSLLIVVGVALETVKQLESQMLMRHYKGFL
ncbi:MAG: preprotein translocase subunit SecY [Cellulosilyticaceae bacterium]